MRATRHFVLTSGGTVDTFGGSSFGARPSQRLGDVADHLPRGRRRSGGGQRARVVDEGVGGQVTVAARDPDGEGAALARAALDLRRSAVQGGQFGDERQADARALDVVVKALKHTK